MTKKTPSPRLPIASERPGSQGHEPFVALRIADLFSLADRADLALDHVRRLDRSARLVIGGNLATQGLGRPRLERLRASVTRQAGEAGEVLQRLREARGVDQVRDEVANLLDFLTEALAEIDRQLGRIH